MRWLTGRAMLVAAALLGGLAPGADAAIDVKPLAALQKAFDTYGNAGKNDRWTGGQLAAAVTLPDKRTVYVGAGTFLGTVNKDGSRPADAPWVNNAYVVQSASGALTRTMVGAGNTDLFAAPYPRTYYNPGGAVVDGGKLYQYLWLNQTDAPYPLRLDLAVLSLPALTVDTIKTNVVPPAKSVQADPTLYPITYGSAVVQDATYNYVFGYENTWAGFAYHAHVVRLPRGKLADGTPEYLDQNGTWTTNAVTSKRLFGGAGMGTSHFSVVKTKTGFRATSQGYLTSKLYVWTATALGGPWTQTYFADAIIEKSAGDLIPDVYPIEVTRYETKPNLIVLSYTRDGGVEGTGSAGDRHSHVRKFRPVFLIGTVS